MSRKEKLKVYHGIPKSVPDKNTIFYASFDGTFTPEIGTLVETLPTARTFDNHITGCGIKPIESYTTTCLGYSVCPDIPPVYTIQFWGEFTAQLGNENVYRGICDYLGTEIQYNNGYLRVGHWENPSVYYYISNNKFHHIRVVIKKITDTSYNISMYINGKLVNSETKPYKFPNVPNMLRIGHRTQGSRQMGISDLLITHTDLGDVFTNLPQDFIDGKAIIKPRFGQQQIKGDPFYSQETTLEIIRPTLDNTYDVVNQTVGSNGYYQSLLKPELSYSHTTLSWLSSSGFKIKGLNGEVIGGVIDTDTALCTITDWVSVKSFKVDDVSKLTVGDTFKVVNTKSNTYDTEVRTISSIDSNIVTFSGTNISESNIKVDGWNMLIETTTTSSTPIVKSSDGVTVNGTWTGLGTNEATFVLSSNSNLMTKDLYVVYSLNIPSGNSDFTELPYAINKVYDEVGKELREVSEIIIEDDFKDKIQGNTITCPHTSGYAVGKTLPEPSTFTEISQIGYTSLESADNVFSTVSGSGGVDSPFQCFSFNLAEIFKRKLGYDYVNSPTEFADFIESITVYCKGKSTYTTSPSFELYAYSKTWKQIGVHSNVNGAELSVTIPTSSVSVSNMITSSGFVHFCVSASANGSVQTDYIKIKIKLKKDSNFKAYYIDNVRAREDSCNPVLIQKETKTVKRLIPTDKCFSTEYLSYGVNPKITTDISTKTHVADSEIMFVTTEGTGMYDNNLIRSSSKNVIARLGVPIISPHLYIPLPLVSKQPWNGSTSAILPYKYIRATNSILAPFNLYNMPQDDLPTCKLVALTKYLDKVNGELFLKVLVQEHSNGVYQAYRIASYKLPNRPLIK